MMDGREIVAAVPPASSSFARSRSRPLAGVKAGASFSSAANPGAGGGISRNSGGKRQQSVLFAVAPLLLTVIIGPFPRNVLCVSVREG